MSRLQDTIENLETGDFVTIETEDGSTYSGEICETQGHIGRELRKLVLSEPQTVIEIVYGTNSNVEDIHLMFESDPQKSIVTVKK